MDQKFARLVESLHPAFERLIACSPYIKGARLPERGVYLFMENGNAIYVGRSNNIRRRHGNHTQPKSPTSLATLIARTDLGLKSDYRKGSKEKRSNDVKYRRQVEKAKKRIIAMEFRAVEENRPNQTGAFRGLLRRGTRSTLQ